MRLVSPVSPQSPPVQRSRRSLPAMPQPVFSIPPLETKSQTSPCEVSTPGASASVQMRCRVVRQLTAEMVMLVSERVQLRRDRRRAACHVRQIAMYVCHVVLQLSLTDIGIAFGRDRTTVGHACNVVEDRRDDKAYDEFLAAIERVVISVFGVIGGSEHE